jgi:hypothetical protein
MSYTVYELRDSESGSVDSEDLESGDRKSTRLNSSHFVGV